MGCEEVGVVVRFRWSVFRLSPSVWEIKRALTLFSSLLLAGSRS